MTLSTLLILAASVCSQPEQSKPRPLVGDALPTGAVARLGPQAFRYAGYAGYPYNGGSSVWYSPNGKQIGVTSSAGIYVWDATTGQRMLWVSAGGRVTTGLLGFSTNGDAIVDYQRKWDDAAAGVFRIDLTTGVTKAKFQSQEERRFVAINPEGDVVYSFTIGNTADTILVANTIDTGKELWRRELPHASYFRVSQGGSRIVTWTNRSDSGSTILDANTGKTVGTFSHEYGYNPTSTGDGLVVGPKAEVVVSAHSWDKGFSVFQAGKEKPIWQVAGSWYDHAFLTDNGKKLIFVRGRSNDNLEVWDVQKSKPISSVDTKLGRTMALSPDGKTLASPDIGLVRLVDVATGKPMRSSRNP